MNFAAVRRAADLPSLVMNHTRLHQRSAHEWRGPCPLHGGKNKWNFAVYREDGTWWYKCHSECQKHGSAIDYVMAMYPRECPDELAAARWLLRSPACLGADIREVEQDSGEWRPKEKADRPTPLQELSWRVVEPYLSLLDLPIDWTGRDKTTPRDLWHREGMDDATIERFKLGFCPDCPTAWDGEQPNKKWPALTIPIWEADTGVLHNVRYRLIDPPSPDGDKYRPFKSGLGIHLYDAQSIWTMPDGSPRSSRGRASILMEGEKKKDFLDGVCELGQVFGIVSPTGGVGSWLRDYGDLWQPLLDDSEFVFVVNDPFAEEITYKTAMRFGRRGYPVYLDQKADDLIRNHPNGIQAGLDVFWNALSQARPVRSRRYFDQRSIARGTAGYA